MYLPGMWGDDLTQRRYKDVPQQKRCEGGMKSGSGPSSKAMGEILC